MLLRIILPPSSGTKSMRRKYDQCIRTHCKGCGHSDRRDRDGKGNSVRANSMCDYKIWEQQRSNWIFTPITSALKMEAAYSFEPLVYTRSALWMLHLHGKLLDEVYLYLYHCPVSCRPLYCTQRLHLCCSWLRIPACCPSICNHFAMYCVEPPPWEVSMRSAFWRGQRQALISFKVVRGHYYSSQTSLFASCWRLLCWRGQRESPPAWWEVTKFFSYNQMTTIYMS